MAPDSYRQYTSPSSGLTLDEAPEDERPIILITTVDIGDGNSDRIVMRRGDDPADAAQEFVQRHALSPAVLGPLTLHMRENLRKAKVDAKARKAEVKSQQAESNSSPPSPPVRQCPDSPVLPCRASTATPPATTSSSSTAVPPRAPLSFDERLSAKLIPVEKDQLVSVVCAADVGRPRSAQMGRTTRSAGPSPRDSVHLRLYGLAADQARRLQGKRDVLQGDAEASRQQTKLRMSWISEEMMRDRTAGPFENYGEMLYAEGLESAASRQARSEAERAERQSHELDGATFRPAITAMAARLDGEPAWSRLSTGMRKQTLERLEAMRLAKEQGEIVECSFRPVINKHSSSMMDERAETLRNLNMTSHEQLYQDASRRQEKMAALSKWQPDDVTFRPAVNNSQAAREYLRRSWERGASNNAGSSGSGGARASAGSLLLGSNSSVSGGTAVPEVVDRLYACQDKYKAKMEEARVKYQGPQDPATGRTLFQPEVNRSPKGLSAHRNKSNKPIGEYLHGVAQEQAAKKSMQVEQEAQHAAAEASMSHSTTTSQRLFRALKLKRFRQIFDYLNEAGEPQLDLLPLVRSPTDRVDSLDGEVRSDVEAAAELWARQNGASTSTDAEPPCMPAANELLHCPPLSFDRFAAVMEEALTQRRKPRSYLVPSPSGKAAQSYSFKPKIDKRSKAMAESRLRPAEASAHLHDLLHKTAEVTREKLDSKRREAEERTLADCTFAPQLNVPRGGRPAVEGRALLLAGTPRPWCSLNMGSTSTPSDYSGGSVSSPRGGPASQYNVDAATAEVATFEALELEVAAMEEQDSQLLQEAHVSHGADWPKAAESPTAAHHGPTALCAPLEAPCVAAEDLAATEAMLLDLLTGTSVAPGAAPTTVGTLLQRLLAAKGMAVEGDSGSNTPVSGTGAAVAPAASLTAPAMAGARRSTKDMPSGVSMYVVPSFGNVQVQGAPAGKAAHGGASDTTAVVRASLQELAHTLADWDHVTDPGMATLNNGLHC